MAPQPVLVTSLAGTVLWTNRIARNALGTYVGRDLFEITLNRANAIERILRLARGTSRPLHATLRFSHAFALWSVWRVDGVTAEEPPFLIFQADSKGDLLSKFLSLKREAADAAADRDRAAEAERRLRAEATHLLRLTQTDRLTGLMNAEGFEVFTKQVLNHPSRAGVFIFADLDRFKFVNDTFGHDAGDTVLREIAQRYSGETRSRDRVARLAGDEFVFWFDGLTKEDVDSTVARLERLTRKPVPWRDPVEGESHELRVGVSFGEAYAPDDGNTFAVLKAVSDKRMYVTKRSRQAGAG